MTTPKSDGSFEEKLEKLVDDCENYSFKMGAIWARAETIREVLGLLRSAEAYRYTDFKNCSDWLEEKLKEPTVVMKDKIYETPDDCF